MADERYSAPARSMPRPHSMLPSRRKACAWAKASADAGDGVLMSDVVSLCQRRAGSSGPGRLDRDDRNLLGGRSGRWRSEDARRHQACRGDCRDAEETSHGSSLRSEKLTLCDVNYRPILFDACPGLLNLSCCCRIFGRFRCNLRDGAPGHGSASRGNVDRSPDWSGHHCDLRRGGRSTAHRCPPGRRGIDHPAAQWRPARRDRHHHAEWIHRKGLSRPTGLRAYRCRAR
jgi:hypothetical protein